MSLTPFIRDFFTDPFGDFDRQLTRSNWFEKSEFKPQCDIKESDKDIVITANLPGVDKKDLNVEVHNGVLTISGEMGESRESSSAEGAEHKWHRVERHYGSYRRQFAVPDSVKPTDITAKYENGVLNVTVPKSESLKPKKVQVQ
eukprot:Sdes_comp14872_c0_seq1m3606